jgi:hypothetical protein
MNYLKEEFIIIIKINQLCTNVEIKIIFFFPFSFFSFKKKKKKSINHDNIFFLLLLKNTIST